MRRLLCVLLLGALAASCGGSETDPLAHQTALPVEEPSTPEAASSTPEPTEEPVRAPLTGLPVEDPSVLERPVLAVKVDNHPKARPQTGLDAADVVFVELVESLTRFLAIFHSTAPERVGPVRSGRFVDADLLPPFHPVMACSGGRSVVMAELRRAIDVVHEEGQGGGWARDSSRRAPHNLYVSPQAQWEGVAGELPAATSAWVRTPEAPGGGSAVTDARLDYPTTGTVAWTWDEASGGWLRSQDGAPHVTLEGTRISAATVVVADVQRTGVTERPFEPVGEGTAVVLRDGQRFEARWRKAGRAAQFEWLTPEGEPFPLARGRTWVELLPSGGSLVTEPAAGTREGSG